MEESGGDEIFIYLFLLRLLAALTTALQSLMRGTSVLVVSSPNYTCSVFFFFFSQKSENNLKFDYCCGSTKVITQMKSLLRLLNFFF